MDNDEQRDAAEERYNRDLLHGADDRTVKPFLTEIAEMAERGLVRIEDVAATARTVEDRMAIWGRRVAHEIDTYEIDR